MTAESKMSSTETTPPPIQAISICGANWKYKKFNWSSPTANITKWSKALEIHLSLLGLKNWMANDDLAHAVVLTVLNDSKYEGVDKAKTAAGLYATLK
ncbi:hypothetical protein C0993_010482, partial [Termitomyces sp. T159_Od127]